MEPQVQELSIYDMETAQVPPQGIAEDLQHLQSRCKVRAFSLRPESRPVADLPAECLTGCSLVLISAGVPKRRGQDWKELARINANIAKLMVEACARFCPEAVVGLMVQPLGAVVPAMAKLYEKKGLDPRRVVGVTTLDSVRAAKFVHEATDQPIAGIRIPVVGGHSGRSIVPLFSQDAAARKLPVAKQKELEALVHGASAQVVQAKQGKGSAALSAAHAARLFARAVLSGLAGKRGVSECALIKSDVSKLQYFASPVVFGRKGVEGVPALPNNLSEHEAQRLREAEEVLGPEVEVGLEYAKTNALVGDSSN